MSKPKRLAKRSRRQVANPKVATTRKAADASRKKVAARPVTVDGYVQMLPPAMQLIVNRLRGLVAAAAPEAIETFKWAQPVYEVDGPFAYIKAHQSHVNFGFWRGAELTVPRSALRVARSAHVLEGDGLRMRHIKISAVGGLDVRVLTRWVQQAVLLNGRPGTPPRR